jgi:hypothetical protein
MYLPVQPGASVYEYLTDLNEIWYLETVLKSICKM